MSRQIQNKETQKKMNQSIKQKVIGNNIFNCIYVKNKDWQILSSPKSEKIYFIHDSLWKDPSNHEFLIALRQERKAYYFSEESNIHYDCFEIFFNNTRAFSSHPVKIFFIKSRCHKISFITQPFYSRSSEEEGLQGDFMTQSYDLIKRAKKFESSFLESKITKIT